SGHPEEGEPRPDDLDESIASVDAPPRRANLVGSDQRRRTRRGPWTIPHGLEDCHVLGIENHSGLCENRLHLVVDPSAAGITTVMVGGRDEIHVSASLLLWNLGEVFGGPNQCSRTGTIVVCALEIPVGVRNH